MMRAYPSSQSSITAGTVDAYLMAVEDVSLEALARGCKAFIKGDVPGHNNSFAPSAPKLVEVCREFDRALVVEQFQAANVFIEEGSERWAQMLLHRGANSLPTFERNGRKGWYFTSEEEAEAARIALPPPISTNRRIELQQHVRKTLNIRLGDDGADGDMGQRGAA